MALLIYVSRHIYIYLAPGVDKESKRKFLECYFCRGLSVPEGAPPAGGRAGRPLPEKCQIRTWSKQQPEETFHCTWEKQIGSEERCRSDGREAKGCSQKIRGDKEVAGMGVKMGGDGDEEAIEIKQDVMMAAIVGSWR